MFLSKCKGTRLGEQWKFSKFHTYCGKTHHKYSWKLIVNPCGFMASWWCIWPNDVSVTIFWRKPKVVQRGSGNTIFNHMLWIWKFLWRYNCSSIATFSQYLTCHLSIFSVNSWNTNTTVKIMAVDDGERPTPSTPSASLSFPLCRAIDGMNRYHFIRICYWICHTQVGTSMPHCVHSVHVYSTIKSSYGIGSSCILEVASWWWKRGPTSL